MSTNTKWAFPLNATLITKVMRGALWCVVPDRSHSGECGGRKANEAGAWPHVPEVLLQLVHPVVQGRSDVRVRSENEKKKTTTAAKWNPAGVETIKSMCICVCVRACTDSLLKIKPHDVSSWGKLFWVTLARPPAGGVTLVEPSYKLTNSWPNTFSERFSTCSLKSVLSLL